MSNNLHNAINDAVVALGFELVGHEWQANRGKGVLRVYIDRLTGVSIDDCARVSRQVSAVLDVENLITGRYELEVSSPGLDRPLFTIEHYRKFIGHKASIRLHTPVEKRRNFIGIIEAVEDQTIYLRLSEDEKVCSLMFASIDKARLIPKL